MQVLFNIEFTLESLGGCLVAQSCPSLCDSMNRSPSATNTGVGCHAFLQGIFPTQRLAGRFFTAESLGKPQNHLGELFENSIARSSPPKLGL